MERRHIENAWLELAVVKAHFEHIRDVLQAILDDDMGDLYQRDEGWQPPN